MRGTHALGQETREEGKQGRAALTEAGRARKEDGNESVSERPCSFRKTVDVDSPSNEPDRATLQLPRQDLGHHAHDERVHGPQEQSDQTDCDRAPDQAGHEPDDELERERADGVHENGVAFAQAAVEVDEDEAAEHDAWSDVRCGRVSAESGMRRRGR